MHGRKKRERKIRAISRNMKKAFAEAEKARPGITKKMMTSSLYGKLAQSPKV